MNKLTQYIIALFFIMSPIAALAAEVVIDQECRTKCAARGGTQCDSKCSSDNSSIDFGCVKACRDTGMSYDDCSTTCGKTPATPSATTPNLDFACLKDCRVKGSDFDTCKVLCDKNSVKK